MKCRLPIKQDNGGLATLYLRGPSGSDVAGPKTANSTEQKFFDGEMKIGYWNVVGLATSGKLKMVTWQRRGMA